MSDHLSDDEISNYRDRLSPAEVLIRVDDHISGCADCRQRIAQAHDITSAVRRPASRLSADTSGRASDHLTYEQLEAYVDDRMSDSERELVRSHMGTCQECAGELRDLQNFAAELSSPVDASPGQRTRRAPAVSRARAWPASPAWLGSRRAALAAALALGAVLTFVWKRESQSPPEVPSSVAETGTPPDRANAKPVEQGRPEPGSREPDSRSRLAAEIAALPPDERRAVSEAIERGEIRLPKTLEELRGRQQTLLGGSHDETLSTVLEPTGEVVMDSQPLFRWQPVAGARSYSVAVFDTSLRQIQHSPALQVTEWKADRPLERGRVYLWQLTATMRDGTTLTFPAPPAPEARLEVLQKEKADELEQFRRSHPNAHLVLGILYARAGMLTPARLELQRITRSDPDYATAQHLLERTAEFGGAEH